MRFSNLTDTSYSPPPPHHSNSGVTLLELDEISILIEEVVDLARQINSEMDSDDVQELLDSHDQELTMDELIEMYEQKQAIEGLVSLHPVHSEDGITVENLTESLNLIEKWLQILENTYSNVERLGSSEYGQHPCPPENRRACRKRLVQHEFYLGASGDSRVQWSDETRQPLYVLAM
ncbi:tigger transposable element-derived protein 1 [Trichonephila clavipes]|nr:tigger transposable element-derived protein 1 [Trichonephila clavipes]